MIDQKHYNFAFLDENSKREIRRSLLKAVAIPGYQVPFGSRELPIGRGWAQAASRLLCPLSVKKMCSRLLTRAVMTVLTQ